MKTKRTHTHRGTCQACGAVQAVDNTTKWIAKHGYTTTYGFFNGTCYGSGYLPMELETIYADATIKNLKAFVGRETMNGNDYESGAISPDSYRNGESHYTGRTLVHHAVDLAGALAIDAVQPYRQIVKSEIDRRVRACRHQAKGAQQHIEAIKSIKAARFGKPLIAVDPPKPAGRFVVRDNGGHQWLVTKRNNSRREFDFTDQLKYAGRFDTHAQADTMRSVVEYWKNRRGTESRFEVVEA